MLQSWSGLPLRAMSRSMVLLKLGSVLLSVAQVITKGQVDARGLVCHKRPHGYLRGVLLQGDMRI